MKDIIKSYCFWFVCFGLSHAIQAIGWAEQGKAFIYLYSAFIVVIMVMCIIKVLLDTIYLKEAIITVTMTILPFAIILGILLFVSWGATKLINVSFYAAYQLITFGTCLCAANTKDKD